MFAIAAETYGAENDVPSVKVIVLSAPVFDVGRMIVSPGAAKSTSAPYCENLDEKVFELSTEDTAIV